VYFVPPLRIPLDLGTGARGQKLEKKFEDIFSRLDTIHERDGQTDWRTDTGRQQRPRLDYAQRRVVIKLGNLRSATVSASFLEPVLKQDFFVCYVVPICDVQDLAQASLMEKFNDACARSCTPHISGPRNKRRSSAENWFKKTGRMIL